MPLTQTFEAVQLEAIRSLYIRGLGNMSGEDVSARMGPAIAALASVPIFTTRDEGHIDLADGENVLMQEHLVDFCKEMMAKNITIEVSSPSSELNSTNVRKAFSNPNGVEGNPEVREAFASYIDRYFNPSISVTADHIVPAAGSSNALNGLLLTLCDAGDSIICPAPAWRGYNILALLSPSVNILPAWVPPTESWLEDSLSTAIIPALEKTYLSAPEPKRIKALVIANPANPVAQCYPENVVREMMNFCHKYAQFTSALSLVSGADASNLESAKAKSALDPKEGTYCMEHDEGYGNLWCAIAGVTYGTFWQMSSLAALFTVAVLSSPFLPAWLSSTRETLRKHNQLCHEVLSVPVLDGRIKILPASAGLWVNVIVTLKEGETFKDFISKTKANKVDILPAQDFKVYYGENQGEFKITFAKAEGVLREGLERLKQSLL
ncbi:hypothetical protein N7468_005463 [Penicillium chermesinum]|uniref:Aminotransferase class I/classII large domain-containing protein n=1 Tax=Penicillium chermesinum TaxID=63820 RepID=A0A9W9TN82_9EURO|nr:uncharacterized protein N7468_005463 [Penicillium chermesinum]KAJ5232507.1 hypothetical protein N7468_005463 [Penicillium chermesinum]